MIEAMKGRVEWQCPQCGRSFYIPKSNPRPALCPHCAGDDSVAARKHSSPPPASEPPAETTAASASASKSPAGPAGLPPEVEHYLATRERDTLNEHLANISRSMTFFKRLVWGMIIMLLINVVITIGGMIYAYQQVSSFGGLLNGAAGLDGLDLNELDAQQLGDPNNRAQLKQFENYVETMNELLREVQNH